MKKKNKKVSQERNFTLYQLAGISVSLKNIANNNTIKRFSNSFIKNKLIYFSFRVKELTQLIKDKTT